MAPKGIIFIFVNCILIFLKNRHRSRKRRPFSRYAARHRINSVYRDKSFSAGVNSACADSSALGNIHILCKQTGCVGYSSGPNKRVHTPIYFRNKIPPHMALLGTTRLLIFLRNSKKKLFQKSFCGQTMYYIVSTLSIDLSKKL